eukprot:2619957-Rhodomonas_salina.1
MDLSAIVTVFRGSYAFQAGFNARSFATNTHSVAMFTNTAQRTRQRRPSENVAQAALMQGPVHQGGIKVVDMRSG